MQKEVPRLTTAAFNALDTDAFDEIISERVDKVLNSLYLFDDNDNQYRYCVRAEDEITAVISLLKNDEFIRNIVYSKGAYPPPRLLTDDIFYVYDLESGGSLVMNDVEYENRINDHKSRMVTDCEYREIMIDKVYDAFAITKLSEILL